MDRKPDELLLSAPSPSASGEVEIIVTVDEPPPKPRVVDGGRTVLAVYVLAGLLAFAVGGLVALGIRHARLLAESSERLRSGAPPAPVCAPSAPPPVWTDAGSEERPAPRAERHVKR